jgi:hypothetical protein
LSNQNTTYKKREKKGPWAKFFSLNWAKSCSTYTMQNEKQNITEQNKLDKTGLWTFWNKIEVQNKHL